MLSIFSGQFDRGFSSQYKILLVSVAILVSGCANITLKPKDP